MTMLGNLGHLGTYAWFALAHLAHQSCFDLSAPIHFTFSLLFIHDFLHTDVLGICRFHLVIVMGVSFIHFSFLGFYKRDTRICFTFGSYVKFNYTRNSDWSVLIIICREFNNNGF